MAIYGVLMFGGGLGGYAKAHSKPSLIAGLVSGLLMAAAYFVSRDRPRLGFGIGAAVAVCLAVVFVRRIQELSAQTPPGSPGMNIGLCALSVLMAIFMILAFTQARVG